MYCLLTRLYCHLYCQVIIMEYRGAGLSKNLSDEPWNYYNQVSVQMGGLGMGKKEGKGCSAVWCGAVVYY